MIHDGRIYWVLINGYKTIEYIAPYKSWVETRRAELADKFSSWLDCPIIPVKIQELKEVNTFVDEDGVVVDET
jgi:hypothetical protein